MVTTRLHVIDVSGYINALIKYHFYEATNMVTDEHLADGGALISLVM